MHRIAEGSRYRHVAGSYPAATDLRRVFLQALREGSGAMRVWLTPTRALGLEAAWVKALEQAG